MAIGDYVTIKQDAGGSGTFSYTAAAGVNIMFTNFAGSSWTLLYFENWVSNTTGVYGWVGESFVNTGRSSRVILLENQTVNGNLHTAYGFMATGVQI